MSDVKVCPKCGRDMFLTGSDRAGYVWWCPFCGWRENAEREALSK